MTSILKSKLFNGNYDYAELMGISSGIKNNMIYNELYQNARPKDIRNDLITDPLITTPFKPPFEPSVNRDKLNNISKYPYSDIQNSFKKFLLIIQHKNSRLNV